VTFCAAGAAAQFIPYSPFGYDRGQDVAPTFDGWVRNPDGTFSLYFGYLNRNAAEELTIPVGPDNTVEPGGDRGQPTYFYPAGAPNRDDRDAYGRRRWWVFRIDVPQTWTVKDRVTWTLISRGKTNKATAWLQPEYEVTLDFIRENTPDGHLFSRGDFDDGNHAPSMSLAGAQTVTLPGTTKLTLTATDDGRPRPPAAQAPSRRAAQNGLRVRWTTYRGPAHVAFAPETSGPFPASPVNTDTTAAFTAPGQYRLRAIVSDGHLYSTQDIDVTVNSGSSSKTAR
jgi:hypothetical protein